MNDTYAGVAWSLFAFLVGLFSGGYIVLRLRSDTSRTTIARDGHEWARREIRAVEPLIQETFVRHETAWNGGSTDGRTISFSILDRSQVRRDMTFTSAQILKFFKSGDDGPRRSGYSGDNNTYSQLLMVGKYYDWLLVDGSSYTWATFLATRERRLRAVEAWTQ